MKIRDPLPPPPGFQLAPMIDIVFLLLLFFLVTYQITEQEKDNRISVPTSTEGAESTRVANEIVINITTEGEISIAGQPYTHDQLFEKLTRLVEASRLAGDDADSQPVRLRTDANTPTQVLFGVMDEVQKAGIWNVRFASKSQE